MSRIRYMGTKRHLLPNVHRCLSGLGDNTNARFVDLFAGTGAVAGSFASRMPVTCNDALAFPSCLGRAQFLRLRDAPPSTVWADFYADVAERVDSGRRRLAHAIAKEREALRNGASATQGLIAEARHPGNDAIAAARAADARRTCSHELVTLYFARGYFSTEQAVALDAIRGAIDEWFPADGSDRTVWSSASQRDILLASWLEITSKVINSPGHTAQFLSARSEKGFRRVRANWSRDVVSEFFKILSQRPHLGSSEWRRRNRITQLDATSLADSANLPWRAKTILYADPPYTKDHYSRYYHVLETLYRYDYPSSRGKARIRDDRHLSDFCYKRRAARAFSSLGRLAQRINAPLIISYPENGLIGETELGDALTSFGIFAREATIAHEHSSLGGSPGTGRLSVEERLYVLRPRSFAASR